MNKIKRRYNWKARQVVQTEVDNETTRKIPLDPTAFKNQGYDECNILALPSEKRASKKKKEKQATITKLLSKKQRKHLEKIVDTKKKKENRASLLEALSKVQVTPEFTAQLTSVATVQTRGLKRQKSHAEFEDVLESSTFDDIKSSPEKRVKISSIAGSRKLRKKLMPLPVKEKNSDPNVLGFDSSSSSSEDSGLEVEEDIKTPIEDSGSESSSGEEEEEKVQASESPAKVTDTEKPATETKAEVPQVDTSKDSEPAVFLPVFRPPDIQAARMKLPVLAEEQAIMETIRENTVVVLAGETGSGKTTQVPQRVAAISMSKRVAYEMGLTKNDVSYLIRFEGSAGPDTRILFMTDGVLLREARTDLLLTRYSVIIVDEAHERSVFTDILVGLLSRIVNLRARRGDPLKLIIMSATLRLSDFTENSRLFRNPPPVIKVESRQFPVTVHFAKRTVSDYVTEAFRKTCKIHTQLPEGGILVFVTGQQEVRTLVRRLRRAFPYIERPQVEEEETEENSRGKGKRKGWKSKALKLPVINLDAYPLQAIDNDDDGESGVNVAGSCEPLWVLPLYSLLPSHQQARVFDPPPSGTRLCVVATNVAETSLTIPGVKLTALGKSVSSFPVAPRFGKMLALSAQYPGLLPHTVSLVAALSVPELLLNPGKVGKTCKLTGQAKLLGDLSVLLRVLYGAERAAQKSEQKLQEFCEQQSLRLKGILETRLLRQVVLSGMVDQVAVKVALEDINDPAQRVKWKHAYRCAELEDPVVMHSDCVLRKSKPQWVVYQEIFETSKMYMRGMTAIEPEWLPVYALDMCNLSQPLPDPPPRYDQVTEKLLCSVTGTFGRAGWELPRMEIEFPKGVDRYKFFAQQLLEGALFPKLQKYKSALLSTPSTVTKTWSNLISRSTTLLNTLAEHEVDSKQKLQEMWTTNPQFLLPAYQQWLPESAHNEVAVMWPPT
ncbi:hypothetical protein B566_EDAN007371 [Ephemera danica]|nr:hypothetical protein B566_EDAN007371 [Ephemera danica]